MLPPLCFLFCLLRIQHSLERNMSVLYQSDFDAVMDDNRDSFNRKPTSWGGGLPQTGDRTSLQRDSDFWDRWFRVSVLNF